MALFITFEGGEGAGKSVQVKALKERLKGISLPVLLTREPGDTALGEKIGHWLKWEKDMAISPMTELLLFNAARSQLVAEVIRPAMEAGKVVICDRFFDSTTAYQSYGRGLNLEMVKAINLAAAQGLKPDVTILLDMPFEEGLARKAGEKPDRFEQEEIAFHEKVRAGYLQMANEEPQRWFTVNAADSEEQVSETIWQYISRYLRNTSFSDSILPLKL